MQLVSVDLCSCVCMCVCVYTITYIYFLSYTNKRMRIIIDHNCNSSYIPNVLSGGTNSVFPPWLKTDVFLVGFVSSYLLSVGWLQSFPDAKATWLTSLWCKRLQNQTKKSIRTFRHVCLITICNSQCLGTGDPQKTSATFRYSV